MSDLEVVNCSVVKETPDAYQLRDSQDESRVEWFPKSQVSFRRRNVKTGAATAEIPLWLLTKKGWNK